MLGTWDVLAVSHGQGWDPLPVDSDLRSSRRLSQMLTLERLARVGIPAIAVIGILTLLPEMGHRIGRAAHRVFRR